MIAVQANKHLKLPLNMTEAELLVTYNHIFMTTYLCVMSAAVVRETLSEGKEDYCMIVCD